MKRVWLVVVTVFAALLVVPSGRAWACSCAQASPAQAVRAADVVFRGVLEHLQPPGGLVSSSEDPTTYTFGVSEVFRGAATTTTDVRSPQSGASCGVEGLRPGREYVVFAQARGEQMWMELCGGTDLAASGLVADVQEITGPGHPPVQPGLVDEAAPLPGQHADPGGTGWLLLGSGLALALGGALVVVLFRRRRTSP